MGLACLKGTGQWSGDPAFLWIPGLTGLGGMAQWKGNLHVCISSAAGLGYVCGRAEIVQACAGLRGVAQ
jgi:hypothetical protein